MVATAHPYATDAALEILRSGGNAVDAAIAAQWVLNVVEPFSSGIGGGGFFLFYGADNGRVYTFDGREKAPAAADPEMFLDATGNPHPFFPDRITGGLPVGVPGTLKLLETVHARFGSRKMTFSELFEPAIRHAREGFMVSARMNRFTEEQRERLYLFDASRRIFLTTGGKPLPSGTVLKQPDLARTFEAIRDGGIDVFYKGEIAEAIVQAVRDAPFHPGRMTKADLANYEVLERDALRGTYRGYEIVGMGPPSSGGTTLLEMLNLLELTNLSGLDTLEEAAVMVEAQKLAFEDRNRFIGDPDQVDVPVERLISKEFARGRAEPIHTSHISIVDDYGNMVAFTTTIEHTYGSGLVVPGWGFLLNNELTDFDVEPLADGTPHPNAPAAQKRPRSSMTPTFVFKESRPYLVIGSPGGSTIIGTVLNIIVNMIDHEMTLDGALTAAKKIHRGRGVELETPLYESGAMRQFLTDRGYAVGHNDSFGNAQGIWFNEAERVLVGASDPRGEGKAEGY